MSDAPAPKQLASLAESLARGETASTEQPVHHEPAAWAVVPDDTGLDTLDEDSLRAATIHSAPARRLAACWRLLVHGQALPRTPPTDGVRLLLLVNLATSRDLGLLEVLLELDPSASVRASAAVLTWRATGDRDRVLELLVASLERERSSTVLVQLLELTPPLPFTRVEPIVAGLLRHPSRSVRAAAMRAWIDGRGSDEVLGAAVIGETDCELRAEVLRRYATSERPAWMPGSLTDPQLRREQLLAIEHVNGRYPLSRLAELVDPRCPDLALRFAVGPFDTVDRAFLIALTGNIETSGPVFATKELLRCLREAFAGASRSHDEQRWIARLAETHAVLTAGLGARSMPEAFARSRAAREDECEWDEGDWDDDEIEYDEETAEYARSFYDAEQLAALLDAVAPAILRP